MFECGDAGGARECIASQRPDIAFLDVEMPGATGLQVAAGLPDDAPIVVFITAFSSYATQAFEVSATDYVLKPFSDDRFREALERAKRRVRERRLGALATQVATPLGRAAPRRASPARSRPTAPRYLQRLALKDGDRSVVLKASDIVWIEAEDYYVLVHSKQGRHLVRATLASLEQRLDPRIVSCASIAPRSSTSDEVRTIAGRRPAAADAVGRAPKSAVSRSRAGAGRAAAAAPASVTRSTRLQLAAQGGPPPHEPCGSCKPASGCKRLERPDGQRQDSVRCIPPSVDCTTDRLRS